MESKAVIESRLRDLVWFLNLDSEILETWDRDPPPLSAQNVDWDKEMYRQRLFYSTGPHDDNRSLIKLQQDLKDGINALLDPAKSAAEALQKILDRIDKIKFSGFRRVLKPEEQIEREKKSEPCTTITLVRVSPPVGDEKGSRRPVEENLALSESDYNYSAQEIFYRIVDNAIRNNIISEVRCCLNCNKFFLRDGRRLTYCPGSRCETKFNNKRRSKAAGYVKKITPMTPKEKRKGKIPAKKGYDVFLNFRNLVLKGNVATSFEQDKAKHVASWLLFDRARAQDFRKDSQALDPDRQWRELRPALKKRFESYAAL